MMLPEWHYLSDQQSDTALFIPYLFRVDWRSATGMDFKPAAGSQRARAWMLTPSKDVAQHVTLTAIYTKKSEDPAISRASGSIWVDVTFIADQFRVCLGSSIDDTSTSTFATSEFCLLPLSNCESQQKENTTKTFSQIGKSALPWLLAIYHMSVLTDEHRTHRDTIKMANLLTKCLKAGLDAYTNEESVLSTIKAHVSQVQSGVIFSHLTRLQVACESLKQHCSSRVLLIIARFADEPAETIKLMLGQMVIALVVRDLAYRSTGWVQKFVLALIMVFLWHLFIEEYV